MKLLLKILLPIIFLSFECLAQRSHPNLVLTKNDVQEIKTSLGSVPLFDKSLKVQNLKLSEQYQ